MVVVKKDVLLTFYCLILNIHITQIQYTPCVINILTRLFINIRIVFILTFRFLNLSGIFDMIIFKILNTLTKLLESQIF